MHPLIIRTFSVICDPDIAADIGHIKLNRIKLPYGRRFQHDIKFDGVIFCKIIFPILICNRNIRPIQCRTFPLIPHIENDKFHLIIDEEEFPYTCPLVHKENKLNKDFIEVTYKVWKILIKNPAVYNLIKVDSKRRTENKDNYTIVI